MKKIASILVLIVAILIIQSLVRSIVSLWQKRDVVQSAAHQLTIEKKEYGQLQIRLKQVETTQFLEEEARNKLFLAKPGENQAILPSLDSTPSASQKEDATPNIVKWLHLFFYEGN